MVAQLAAVATVQASANLASNFTPSAMNCIIVLLCGGATCDDQ